MNINYTQMHSFSRNTQKDTLLFCVCASNTREFLFLYAKNRGLLCNVAILNIFFFSFIIFLYFFMIENKKHRVDKKYKTVWKDFDFIKFFLVYGFFIYLLRWEHTFKV